MCVYVNPVLDEVEISFLCAVFMNQALHAQGGTQNPTLLFSWHESLLSVPHLWKRQTDNLPAHKRHARWGQHKAAVIPSLPLGCFRHPRTQRRLSCDKSVEKCCFGFVFWWPPLLIHPRLTKKRPFQLKATQTDPITHYGGRFREYHQWKFL